jgi:hypothetical protein
MYALISNKVNLSSTYQAFYTSIQASKQAGAFKQNRVQDSFTLAHRKSTLETSVVDPKLFILDPDPTLTVISDPDPDSDPNCL